MPISTIGSNGLGSGAVTSAKLASAQTLSVNGITFPATQVPSANANTLDDYEEGSWTPVVSSGGFSSLLVNRATYTKIGNRVWIATDLQFIGTGNSSVLQISGLPFTVISQGWSPGSCYFQGMNTEFDVITCLPNSGSSFLTFQVVTTIGTGSTAIGTDIAPGYCAFSAFYEVA
jgi:hypothetical protein